MAERLRKQKYKHGKSVANQWLEWHFGWSPLIDDIHSACVTLAEPVPLGKVKGAASIPYALTGSANSPGQWGDVGVVEGRVKARVGAEVSLTDSNLYLLNRLGLANPLSVAWEVVPYSFVVDLFITFGAFLDQFTDQMGLEVKNPWHSLRSKEVCQYTYTIVGNPVSPWHEMLTLAEGYRRYQGIPDVTIQVRPVTGVSVKRAATAISLLIQKLPSR